MPIQIIITGNDAPEVMSHLASFIGLRGINDLPAPQGEEYRQAPQEGNGAAAEAAEAEAPAPAKKKPGRPPKQKTLEERQAVQDDIEGKAEVQAEIEAEAPEEADIEKDRDRVRAALNTHYVDVYGMDATIPDVLALYKMRFPDGSVTKVSDIPLGMHDTVIQDIKDMSRTNHFKRKRVDAQL